MKRACWENQENWEEVSIKFFRDERQYLNSHTRRGGDKIFESSFKEFNLQNCHPFTSALAQRDQYQYIPLWGYLLGRMEQVAGIDMEI